MTKPAAKDGLSAEFTAELLRIGIAPENPRANNAPDADIPSMAETLDPAVGFLLNALLVRKGRKGEKDFMVLEGSRRMRAFTHLVEEGRITLDHKIRLIECVTPEAIAAACGTANTHRRAIKPADLILSIATMRLQRIPMDRIAKGLCMTPDEVKLYEKYNTANIDLIRALQAEHITFEVFKMLARLPKDEQAAFAKQLEDGVSLTQWNVSQQTRRDGISENNQIALFITKAEYEAAGGALDKDLFEEKPDQLTDTAVTDKLWKAKITPIVEAFKALGLKVYTTCDTSHKSPEGYKTLGYSWSHDQRMAQALTGAKRRLGEASSAFKESEKPLNERDDEIMEVLMRFHEKQVINFDGMPIEAVVLHPSNELPVSATFYTTESAMTDWKAQVEAAEAAERASRPKEPEDKVKVREVKVDVSNHNHVFHAKAVRIGTRALQVSVASDFGTVLKVLTASMFRSCAVNSYRGDDHLLRATFSAKVNSGYETVAGVDEAMIETLRGYQAAFRAADDTVMNWINTLDIAQIQELLGILTAINLVVTEERTDGLKKVSRSEAQEISDMLAFDVKDVIVPGAELYALASKKQLLAYAAAMEIDDDKLIKMKKADLATFIGEQAIERHWTPQVLDFENDVLPIDPSLTEATTHSDAADQAQADTVADQDNDQVNGAGDHQDDVIAHDDPDFDDDDANFDEEEAELAH